MYQEHVIQIHHREFNGEHRHVIPFISIPFDLELEERNAIGKYTTWREQLHIQEPSREWYLAQDAKTIEEDHSHISLHC